MTSVARLSLIALGSLSVAVGAVGIVVPGLPTTVFLLIASACFAKASPRLRRRLWRHRIFGRYLRMACGGRMPRRAAAVSMVAMWAGIATCALVASAPPTGVMILLGSGIVGTGAIAWMATRTVPMLGER